MTHVSEPSKSGAILSPNFTEQDLSDWTNCALLIPHEPIRSGLNTFVQITNPEQNYFSRSTSDVVEVESTDNGRGKQIKLLFRWYNRILYRFIHHHHDAEENIYFPWLQKRTEKLPPKITKDHVELVEMMENIKNLENTFFDEAGDLLEETFVANLKQLHEMSIELKDSMWEHLNEEELIVPELLRKHNVTEKEHEAVVLRIGKSGGVKSSKIGLPWIIDCMMQWGGPEMVKEFRSGIPWLIRRILKKWWNPYYVKKNKGIALRISDV